MYWLDIVLLVPLLYGVYKGFKNGLIKEIVSFFSFIIGLFAALKFSSFAKELLLENNLLPQQYAPLASFVLTFLAVVILLNIFGRITERIIKAVLLGFVNKLLGAIFGALKFLLLIGTLVLFIDRINQKLELINSSVLDNSVLYPPILSLCKLLLPFFRDLI